MNLSHNKQPSLWPRVFVYGTLKQGGALHGNLRGAKFIGTLRIVGYALKWGQSFPAAFETRRVSDFVAGEVYELEGEAGKDILKILDRVEGVAQGLFRRITVNTATYGEVFVYVQDPPVASYSVIPDGMWRIGDTNKAVAVVGGGLPPEEIMKCDFTLPVTVGKTAGLHDTATGCPDGYEWSNVLCRYVKKTTSTQVQSHVSTPVTEKEPEHDLFVLLGWEYGFLKRPEDTKDTKEVGL